MSTLNPGTHLSTALTGVMSESCGQSIASVSPLCDLRPVFHNLLTITEAGERKSACERLISAPAYTGLEHPDKGHHDHAGSSNSPMEGGSL